MAKARIAAIGRASRIQSITRIEQTLRLRRANRRASAAVVRAAAAQMIVKLPRPPPSAGPFEDYGTSRIAQGRALVALRVCIADSRRPHHRGFLSPRKSEKARRNSATEIGGIRQPRGLRQVAHYAVRRARRWSASIVGFEGLVSTRSNAIPLLYARACAPQDCCAAGGHLADRGGGNAGISRQQRFDSSCARR